MRQVLLAVFLMAGTAYGQHDAARNATWAIAEGDLVKAEKVLAEEKRPGYEAENAFVRMMIALKRSDVETAVARAEEAMAAGLPLARLAAGPRELLGALYETEAWRGWVGKAENGSLALLHGPMLGRVTDASASFWMRTAQPAEVRVLIEGGKKAGAARTSEGSDFTTVVTVNGLEAGTNYEYAVEVDGVAVPASSGSLTTFPEEGKPGTFTVAFGGGAGYAPEFEHMWETIADVEPGALFLLGDNVYIDQPEFSLAHYYCYYRRQARPEWRRLVGGTSVYAIYDDHDFGKNDCVPGPEIEVPSWKRRVWNIFRQNWVNPGYGGGDAQPGCWYDFRIADVHFIMLDGRYYRDRKGKTMLGPVQKAWLKETLAASEGTFKVLASPVPWTAGIKPGSRDPWDGYPEEREEIFSFIEEEGIAGVFLISADRHRTDLRVTERENGYDFYEFESSRLTNYHTHEVIETPGLVWGYNDTCSFAVMRFDTTAADPIVRFECITIDGEVVETYELRASALR